MHAAFVRIASRHTTTLLALTTLTAVAACNSDLGASRLKNTHQGMRRDSVIEILGQGPLTATGMDTVRLVNGHRSQAFFINGRPINVVWYREQPGTLRDSIVPSTDTPVVFTDDTLAGWGWKYFLADGAKLGLIDPRKPPVAAMEGPTSPGIVGEDTTKRPKS